MLWRTTGLWGTGLGRDLNADEIDGNFFELAQAIAALVLSGGINSIDDFSVTGDQMTVLMTDHTTRGPFTLPSASWNSTGVWQALHVYSLRDTFSINGTVYEVILAHTSAASFDANANNGSGGNYYNAMISSPENTLPEGGIVPMVLKKFSASDFITIWDYVLLDELFDVALTSPLEDGQALVWNDGLGKWVNGTLAVPSLDDITGTLPHGKTLSDRVQAVTSTAGELNLDRTLGDVFTITLTENITQINVTDIDWSFPTGRQRFELFILNPDSHNITSTDHWTNVTWEAGTPPPIGHILWVEVIQGMNDVVLIGRILFSS